MWVYYVGVPIGGFQGRTNKLVDSCYSYWQGAAGALLTMIRCGDDDIADCTGAVHPRPPGHAFRGPGDHVFNQGALQRYILHCAQDNEDGGMRDKPGKARDFYHR